MSDLTANGAGLSVATMFGLPSALQLAIDGETGSRRCKVIWTDGKKLGVSFE